ncbi:MAG TPA: universal stress protein [Chloroflexota bacterium]|nr:universal stress protein [Chloroflexota bacterium]
MSQTIIVPLDGSDRAERAIPWAAEIARATGASITLVQIIPPAHTRPSRGLGAAFSTDVPENLPAELHAAAEQYLGRLRAEVEASGLETLIEVGHGDVAPSILDIADERGASVIVVASHGHGGLTRFMIRSVAQRIAQQALIPVLVVRSSADSARQPSVKRILVPLDGSALAESGIELVNQLADTRAELVLARVVQPATIPGTGDIGYVVDSAATEEALADAEKYLANQVEALDRVGLNTRHLVRTGNPGGELRKIADEQDVDLIAMTTHGRTGLDRFMLGSVADELIRHAAQPVLLVSARAVSTQLLEPYQVRDVMTRDVASVREDEPLGAAISKLLRRRVSGAPVLNAKGEIVGVISEHDLLAWHAQYVAQMAQDESMLDSADYRRRLESDRVASIMTTSVIVVERDAPLSAAVHLLQEHRLPRLPVISDGRLVGILTRSDVLRALSLRSTQVTATASSP